MKVIKAFLIVLACLFTITIIAISMADIEYYNLKITCSVLVVIYVYYKLINDMERFNKWFNSKLK